MKITEMTFVNWRFGIHILAVCGIMFMILTMSNKSYVRGQKAVVKPLLIIKDANNPSLSFDGRRIAVGPEIGVEEVYDVDTGKKMGTYREKDSEVGILSADGKRIRIFGSGVHTTYDVETGKKLFQGNGGVHENGKKVGWVTVSYGSGLPTPNFSSELAMVADVLAPKNSDYDRPDPQHPAILVGRLENNSLVRKLIADDGFVRADYWDSATMTPDGNFVAAHRRNPVNSKRERTVIWNVDTGQVVFSLPFWSHGISLSDDGSRFVSRKDDGKMEIEIWDVRTGNLISTLTQKARGRVVKVHRTAISPNGKIVVTTRDAEFYFWDADTGKFITSQRQDDVSGGDSKIAVFSGDGRRIAIGTFDEVITVWSVDEILKNAKR